MDGSIDEHTAVQAILEPGEFALHHFKCVHGSGPNTTSEPRIGLQVLYMSTECRKKSGGRESASLVSGSDDFNHWELEPEPTQTMGEAEIRAHQRAMKLENENYFADSQ